MKLIESKAEYIPQKLGLEGIYKEKLIILDFCSGSVDIYLVEYKQEPDMCELLDKLGHRESDCLWMFTSNDITFHKEVLK